MRILHVLGELKFSGAEVMLKSASRKFEEAKIRTHILSTGDLETGNYTNELSKCGYEVSHIPFRKNFQFIYFIAKFFNANKFDIVHIHSERFFLVYIIIARLAGNKRIFRTIHNTFKFTGLLALRRKAFLKSGEFFGCIYLSISSGVQCNELKLNSINSELINNWIDTNHFIPKGNKYSKSKTISIISVGACSLVKQHCLILKLVEGLIKRNQEVVYYHLGSGELELHERELARKFNIESNVMFVGNQSNVLEWLHEADFFIMPSLYEGLGNSCAEAMSAGLLPIVSDVPGLRDLVLNDKNGLLLNFQDIEKAADRIIDLAGDDDKVNRLQLDARKHIEQNYGLNNVDKLIKIYRDL